MPETTTQLLHRLTRYEPGREWDEAIADDRIVQDLVANDPDHFPRFYKDYAADLPRIALPRELPAPPDPATAILAGSDGTSPTPLDLPDLARLLYLSAGVTRAVERRGRRWLFRASGSAGARFPLELYVSVPDGAGLPAGVHWYDPEEHALVQVGPPPADGGPAIVTTGVPWRTGWRYRERGYRHIYWDAGTMLAQLLAVADSAGVTARLFTRFPDAAATDLVGADGTNEFPVAIIALGPDKPALQAAGPATAGRMDADGREFPLVTAAQHAGDQDDLGPDLPRGAPVEAADASAPLDEIILRRGSTRLMDTTRSMSRAAVAACMAAAMRGIDIPHWLVIHAVDGVEPGLYRWPDLDNPLRRGNLREDAYQVALEQGLARDAAFVAISAIDIDNVDDRRYRELQLLAGIVEGRLHLMAYALGAGATGMTFQDADIPAFLGANVACLLWTCVGYPEYQSRPGGPPGAPATFRMIIPR